MQLRGKSFWEWSASVLLVLTVSCSCQSRQKVWHPTTKMEKDQVILIMQNLHISIRPPSNFVHGNMPFLKLFSLALVFLVVISLVENWHFHYVNLIKKTSSSYSFWTESTFGLNQTQRSNFFDKFSLDIHNSHVGNAVGHGHKGHLWPKCPYMALIAMAIGIAIQKLYLFKVFWSNLHCKKMHFSTKFTTWHSKQNGRVAIPWFLLWCT